MNTFPIPDEVIEELIHAGSQRDILDPEKVFQIGSISDATRSSIAATSPKVFISKRALKHIIDRRGNEKIIYLIPEILSNPTKIVNNFAKRQGSFIFAKLNGKHHGVVVEITKTPDCENQVVSAFIIDPRTYRKMSDVSGGTAPRTVSPHFLLPH